MRVLFGVSSVGLGHASRSYGVARELERLKPKITIDWIAGEPALTYLKHRNVRLLEVSKSLESLSRFVEESCKSGEFKISLKNLLLESRVFKKNWTRLRENVDFERYDMLVLDEFWEVLLNLHVTPRSSLKVFITDFLEAPPSTYSLEWLVLKLLIDRGFNSILESVNKLLYVGYGEELLTSKFRLLTLRRLLDKICFTGYIVSFDLEELKDVEKLRSKIVGDHGRLLVVTWGGSSAGSNLLDLAVKLHKRLCEEFKNLKTLVVCGPRLNFKPFNVYGLETIGYHPELYKLLYLADCVVCRAGTSTISELAVLNVPSVTIPIPKHYEQEKNAKVASKKFSNIFYLREEALDLETLARIIFKLFSRGREKVRSRMFLNKKIAAKRIVELMEE